MTTALPLPERCDVLVVGAGPAGSACAQVLARGGLDVVLADRHDFPRDKVCGDGLIPDAHRALRRLGVHDEVMALAHRATHVGCIGPMGGRVDVPGHLAVLPRRQLDDILKRAAERAGAGFCAPWRFEGPVVDAANRVVGATLRQGDTLRTVSAGWVVLATGAVPQALMAAGLCERTSPSAVALRQYIHHPGMVARLPTLEVVWHRRLRQGYGWIFPCGDGVFNVGVGLARRPGADDGRLLEDVNLRELFATFGQVHAAAGELIAHGQAQGPLKGAPLRCSLTGARYTRPGLLATGEATGSTYAFTGEGIGKAMETGLMAAESLLEGQRLAEPEAATRARYEAALLTLKPRFDLYERAARVNDHPWLTDLLIWRARRSPGLVRRMAGVLEEVGNPASLVTLRGVAKLFMPLR